MIRRYGQNYTLKFLTGIIEPQIPLTETGLKVRYHFTKFAGWDWVLTAKSVPTKKKIYIEKRAGKMTSIFEKLKLVTIAGQILELC